MESAAVPEGKSQTMSIWREALRFCVVYFNQSVRWGVIPLIAILAVLSIAGVEINAPSQVVTEIPGKTPSRHDLRPAMIVGLAYSATSLVLIDIFAALILTQKKIAGIPSFTTKNFFYSFGCSLGAAFMNVALQILTVIIAIFMMISLVIKAALSGAIYRAAFKVLYLEKQLADPTFKLVTSS